MLKVLSGFLFIITTHHRDSTRKQKRSHRYSNNHKMADWLGRNRLIHTISQAVCHLPIKTFGNARWQRFPSCYDTIRDAILTCARKPTRVSIIYSTEPTTKKCKNRRKKTKSSKQVCSEITVNSPGNPRSKYLSRGKERLQWEGFAEKEGFKPGVEE